MDDQLTQEQIGKIENALAAGRKIDAIKIYREATGKGLKESKDYIESIHPRQQQQEPESHASLKSSGSGCASVIFVGVGLTTAVAWLVASLA